LAAHSDIEKGKALVKELIEFLLKIEKMAADIYKNASVFFKPRKHFLVDSKQ
jgi:hypothetical protein